MNMEVSESLLSVQKNALEIKKKSVVENLVLVFIEYNVSLLINYFLAKAFS